MRILFVGDVVGRPGRDAVRALLPALRAEFGVDLAIVNGENAAGGAGLTAEIARELQAAGADVVTNGNHVWDQRAFVADIERLRCASPTSPRNGRGWLVARRPSRRPRSWPGRRSARGGRRREPVTDPAASTAPRRRAKAVRLAWTGALRCWGAPTCRRPTRARRDRARLRSGMVGSWDSVLGLDPAVIVGRFRDGMPRRFQVGSGPVAFNSVLVDVDETTGRARSIARVDREVAAAT